MRFPSQSSVTVNPMSPRDLDLAIEWAARDGRVRRLSVLAVHAADAAHAS